MLIICMLLSITKLQNLKAIHNEFSYLPTVHCVVVNHKTTKFESNSQQIWGVDQYTQVVVNHKTTKFESNSQQRFDGVELVASCCQSQNYKI